MNKNKLAFVAIEIISGQSYLFFERQFCCNAYEINSKKRELLASNMINVKCLELMSTHIYFNRMRISYIKELEL